MSEHVQQPDSGREAKRARFAGAAPGGPRLTPLMAVLIVAGGALAGLALRGTSIGGDAAAPQVAAAPAARNEIRAPLADLDGGKAQFFRYTAADGRAMRFFAVKSADGQYRAALDACDVCYQARQGYYQDGDEMVCRKCTRRFPSTGINEVAGGCNPVGLPVSVDGAHLVIESGELESRSRYF
jgi:hypothetical protein